MEVRLRHQPQYWLEIRHALPDSRAPGRSKAAGNIMGNGRTGEAAAAFVPAHGKRSSVRTGAPQVAGSRPLAPCGGKRGDKLMSAARRVASQILRGALRWAPQASQEWAQAMLAELDYIESDW